MITGEPATDFAWEYYGRKSNWKLDDNLFHGVERHDCSYSSDFYIDLLLNP